MRLITSNLYIKPLNLYELETLITGLQSNKDPEFAILPNRYRNPLFRDCLMNDIRNSINKNPNEYLFHTIWLIIHKDNKHVAGHIFFSGNPGLNGEVELYTEIFEEEKEYNYLKESLEAILSWAASINKIKLIRTVAPVNDTEIRGIMTETGFEKTAKYHHHENWIWKNEKYL